jgi:predicted nucleotidyltransferase component of viral defense system
MDKSYIDTVRLLLEAAPEVFRSGVFAMKGGTAINLFVQDLPRLSVDIDVVYVAHTTPRAAALAEIAAELTAIRDRLKQLGLAAEVTATAVGDETKIFVRRGRDQVKIEINHVFRGTVLRPESRPLVKAASDLFTVGFSVPTLAVPELYGSKLVAALDRQHARDFFDVHGMLQTHGLRADTVECFVAYLAGHNRPVHEVLFSRDLDMGPAFENEFVGMERVAVSLADLQATRDRLRRELLAALTEAQKRFLLSLVAAAPNWALLPFPHLAELPAVQWKLQNLARLKKSNPTKFKAQTEELEKRFG